MPPAISQEEEGRDTGSDRTWHPPPLRGKPALEPAAVDRVQSGCPKRRRNSRCILSATTRKDASVRVQLRDEHPNPQINPNFFPSSLRRPPHGSQRAIRFHAREPLLLVTPGLSRSVAKCGEKRLRRFLSGQKLVAGRGGVVDLPENREFAVPRRHPDEDGPFSPSLHVLSVTHQQMSATYKIMESICRPSAAGDGLKRRNEAAHTDTVSSRQ